jgi:hypothetical protein
MFVYHSEVDAMPPLLATPEAIRAWQDEVYYPVLLREVALEQHGILSERTRHATGLRTVAVRHGALTPVQLSALGEFRLHQYVLCGFYDIGIISAHQMREDPALAKLPSDTIHLFVGTNEGRILAYFYMQPAPGSPPLWKGAVYAGATHLSPAFGDKNRPLFPCEFESFGPGVFDSLPGLRGVSTSYTAELSCLLRNQVVQSPLGTSAVVEAICAMARIQMKPELRLVATVGCMGVEARRVTYQIGMPALYAADAPVLHNRLDFYWSRSANAPGRFWPFVFATADLSARVEYFDALDMILSLPPREQRAALVALVRRGERIPVRAMLPNAEESSMLWTPDPIYAPASAAV